MRRPFVREVRKTRGVTREVDRAKAIAAAARAEEQFARILLDLEEPGSPPVVLALRMLVRRVAAHLVERIGPVNAGLMLVSEAARYLPSFRDTNRQAIAEAEALFSKEAA